MDGLLKFDVFISYSHVDGALATGLREALQALARPWYRRRALHVFQDESNLNASPGLWTDIRQALAQSRYLVLLASEAAAASPWVAKEVRWWLENRSPETLLIVLTGGEIGWDDGRGVFDAEVSTALPEILRGAFAAEPLYVDLRWARERAEPSLKEPRFRSAVLDLAAPIHGTEKEELDSADLRRHRRVKRLVATVVLVLTALALAALWQARRAGRARGEARDALHVSQVEQLFTQARVEHTASPPLGLLLAVEAEHRARETLGRGVPGLNGMLTQGLRHTLPSRVITSPAVTAEGTEVWDLFLSPDGRWLVTGTGWLLDLQGEPQAEEGGYLPGRQLEVPFSEMPHGRDYSAEDCDFSPDGRYLAVAADFSGVFLFDLHRLDEPPRRIEVGHPVVAVDFDREGRRLALAGSAAGEDGLTVVDLEGGGRRMHLLDPPQGARVLRPVDVHFADAATEVSDPSSATPLSSGGHELLVFRGIGFSAWRLEGSPRRLPLGPVGAAYTGSQFDSGPHRLLALEDEGDHVAGVWDGRFRVHRLPRQRPVLDVELEERETPRIAAFSGCGRYVAWIHGRTLEVRPLAEVGQIRRRLTLDFDASWLRVACDGGWVAVGGEDDPFVRLWGPGVPDEAPRLLMHDTEATTAVFRRDRRSLYTASRDGRIRRWDLTSRSPVQIIRRFTPRSPHVRGVSVSAGGDRMLVQVGDDARLLRHAETGKARSLPPVVGRDWWVDFETGFLWEVVMEPREDRGYYLNRKGTLVRRDLETVERWTYPFTLPEEYGNGPLTVLSPDERFLVAGTYSCYDESGGSVECESHLAIFDLQRPDREPASLADCCQGDLVDLTFDPSHRWLVVAGSGGVRVLEWGDEVTLEDLAGRSLRRLGGFRSASDFGGAIHFGDEGRLLAVGSPGELFLWETDGWLWEPHAALDVSGASILGFLDSGERLVVSLAPRLAAVLDVEEGGGMSSQDLFDIGGGATLDRGGGGGPWLLAEAPPKLGRQRLLRWPLDGRLPRSPGEVWELEASEREEWSLSPDDSWLAVWRDDRVTLVLHDTDELLRAACRAVGRNLTAGEWNRYIGDRWPYRSACPDLPADEPS